MSKIEEDLKLLEELKGVIDTDFGKGKEIANAIDNVTSYVRGRDVNEIKTEE